MKTTEPQPSWKDHKNTVYLITAAIFCDGLCSLLFYLSANGWDLVSFLNPAEFFTNLAYFTTEAADLMLLFFVRLVALPFFIHKAIQVGSPTRAIARATAKKMGSINEPFYIVDSASTEIDGEPLLGEEDIEFDDLLGEGSSTSNKSKKNKLRSSKEKINEENGLSEEEKKKVKDDATHRKNIFIAAIFAFLTACQVMLGIKAVVFIFDNISLQGSFMGLGVVWINIELWVVQEIIRVFTLDAGYMLPAVHQHPLYFAQAAGRWCNLCRTRIRRSYRCPDCEFDLCDMCFKTKSKARAENVLRGDSGVKEELEITGLAYSKQAMVLLKPHYRLIVVAFSCLLVNSCVSLLLPKFQGRILDNVINMDKSAFINDIIFYVSFSVATGAFGGLRNLCFEMVGRKMEINVRNRLFDSIIVQDIAFFDGTTTGELTSRLGTDTNAMISPVRSALSTLLSSSISLGGGLVMCLSTSWRLSMLAFTTIGPIVLLYRIYAKWSQKVNREIWAAYGDASSYATQAFTNIRTVRAFSRESLEQKKYFGATGEALSKGIKDAKVSAGTFALTNYIDLAVGVLLLFYGGLVVMEDNGSLSVGDLITFQLYWNMINNSYNSLTNVLTAFTKAGGAAQRVMNLMGNIPDIDPNSGEKVSDLEGDIEMKDVEFYYQMRPDNKVLRGVNLTIEKGSVCAFVGKSGGGKSTLIHLLMRFYDPKAGSISFGGKDLRDLHPISLREMTGIVAQDTQLFDGSIEENIGYGVDKYTKEEVYEAAKKANAHDFILEFDEGYQTRVGDRGVRLSGGQKQRIAIARCFLKKPQLLFLDEATSALDAESEAQVQDAIDSLISLGECTVVLVAHRLSTVVNADKIAVIDGGHVVEQGTHDQLLKEGGVYAKLVHRQISKMQNTLSQDGGTDPADLIDKLLGD